MTLLKETNYGSYFPCTSEGTKCDFYCPPGSTVWKYGRWDVHASGVTVVHPVRCWWPCILWPLYTTNATGFPQKFLVFSPIVCEISKAFYILCTFH